MQIETAVERNPLAPDYAHLDHMLSTNIRESGQVSTLEFTRWSTGVLRDQAQILKQARLWDEEVAARARSHASGKGGRGRAGAGEAGGGRGGRRGGGRGGQGQDGSAAAAE